MRRMTHPRNFKALNIYHRDPCGGFVHRLRGSPKMADSQGMVKLLLFATASIAIAGQLPRFDRAAAKLRAVRSEIRGAPTPQPIPPRSANATAAYALLRRDFLFFERFTVLFLRSVSRAVIAFRDWLGRSIGYPPRVMVVTLQGIIAADDEIRGARALLVADSDDLLLLDEEDSSNGWRERFRPRARGRPGGGSQLINLERCEKHLERAFSAHGTRAVCLVINSPGGSPVQSSLIYERLRALRKQYKRVPLIAFVEDSACSGGYYIACAADEIIADPSSLVRVLPSNCVRMRPIADEAIADPSSWAPWA